MVARHSSRIGSNWATLVALSVTALGCASSEPGVLQAGSRNLKCQRGEVEMALNRETAKVREYLVGCEFMYTRVHCTDAGCYPAKIKPPCIGDVPCFKEDPVTLEWIPEEPLAELDQR
jgi:hypothetical protein